MHWQPNGHLLTLLFAELDLPEYESYDILRSQVLKAITAGSDYFGFA
jgi:E3 ubiquitin-protein ligase HUWE1